MSDEDHRLLMAQILMIGIERRKQKAESELAAPTGCAGVALENVSTDLFCGCGSRRCDDEAARNARSRKSGLVKYRSMKTFEEARRRLPACCVGASDATIADTGKTISALVAAVEHELTMYAEDQDGCITAKERTQCVRYLQWLKGQAA